MKDKEFNEQERLRDRIGSYHKHIDNTGVHKPLPQSPDFIPDHERYNKDFAAYDKEQRALKILKK
jgi:hypothetical protein